MKKSNIKIGTIVKMKENHHGERKGIIGLIMGQYHDISGKRTTNDYKIYFPCYDDARSWFHDYEFEIIGDALEKWRK